MEPPNDPADKEIKREINAKEREERKEKKRKKTAPTEHIIIIIAVDVFKSTHPSACSVLLDRRVFTAKSRGHAEN